MLGLTQQQLAEMIGVSYQQAHEYERGINRVSAGRLFEIARALSAPRRPFSWLCAAASPLFRGLPQLSADPLDQ